ncbi:MAG: hypothetical protein FWC54_03730 [Actinomycetia bacterium]|nr:hypothetical protein [Actinomycetes bacterium]
MTKLRRTYRRRIIAALLGAALVAAVAGAGVSLYRQGQMRAAYGVAYSQRPYDATMPLHKVSPTKQFSFALDKNVDLNKTTVTGAPRAKDDLSLSDVAQVFSDPDLQHQVPAEVWQSQRGAAQVIVSPAPGGVLAADYRDATVADSADPKPPQIELVSPDTWNGFARYYLVRYIGADGKKLRRPVVTMFTVDSADFALQAPASVRSSVTPDGDLHVSWSPVKGATGYQLVLEKEVVDRVEYSDATRTSTATIVVSNPDIVRRELRFSVARQTDKTSTDLTDKALFAGVFKISEDEIETNRAFVEQNGGINPYWFDIKQFSTKDNGKIALAVVATRGAARGPLEFHSLMPLLSQIPLSPARFAQEQLGTKVHLVGQGSASKQGSAPDASRAMTMADGSTTLVQKGSSPARFAYKKDSIDWSTYREVKPQTAMAQVPYPVNGSTDFVKFLATNLMAGDFYLDATEYLNAPDAPAIDDVLDEAVDQNPYILYDSLSVQTIERDSRTLLYITPFYKIENWKELQQQLWAKVQAVDAQIITSGMSDQAKARAINAWLIAHASYDTAAFDASTSYQDSNTWDLGTAQKYYRDYPYAQNATGVLLKGTGVCASYAAAFKALADQAGLPCIFVTGTVKSTGEGHAWVKVRLDGRWLIVDSAWNDVSESQTRYFGLTDTSKQADRTQDADFMLDAFIPHYAN